MLDELRNGSFVHLLNFKSDRLQTPAVSVGGLCERVAKVTDCAKKGERFIRCRSIAHRENKKPSFVRGLIQNNKQTTALLYTFFLGFANTCIVAGSKNFIHTYAFVIVDFYKVKLFTFFADFGYIQQGFIRC